MKNLILFIFISICTNACIKEPFKNGGNFVFDCRDGYQTLLKDDSCYYHETAPISFYNIDGIHTHSPLSIPNNPFSVIYSKTMASGGVYGEYSFHLVNLCDTSAETIDLDLGIKRFGRKRPAKWLNNKQFLYANSLGEIRIFNLEDYSNSVFFNNLESIFYFEIDTINEFVYLTARHNEKYGNYILNFNGELIGVPPHL